MKILDNKVVEFVGLAGVGKSHVRRALLQTSEDVMDGQVSNLKLIGVLLKPRSLQILYATIQFVLQMKPTSVRLFFGCLKRWFKYQILIDMAKKHRRPVLLDEGAFQKLRYIKQSSRKSDITLKEVNKKNFDETKVAGLCNTGRGKSTYCSTKDPYKR